MTKDDLRKMPGGQIGMERTLQMIESELVMDGVCRIPNIGTLKVVARAERPGRNPKTGEAVMIPARKAVKFIPTKELKAKLNA